MAIQVTFNLEDDTNIAGRVLDFLPRVGEVIWFIPQEKYKPYRVIEVCHWVSVEDDYHAACVYIEEMSGEWVAGSGAICCTCQDKLDAKGPDPSWTPNKDE